MNVNRVLPFRWIMPIAQLLVSFVFLWPVRGGIIWELKFAVHERHLSKAPPLSDEVVAIIASQRPPTQKSNIDSEKREWFPQVLNLPSGLIQLPYVMLSPSKQEWVPVGLDFMTWRVISWPLLGLIFWWSAGRGIDALLAARRRLFQPKMTGVEAVIGSVCFAFCATAAICFPLFSGKQHDPDLPLTLFSIGFAMWAVLGGTVVLAKVLQWRMAKRSPLTV